MFARLQRADGQPILLLSSGWAGPERRSERSLGTCHDVLRQENITTPLSAYPGEFERLCHVPASGGRIKLEEDLQDAIRLETADSGHGRRRVMNAGAAIEA